MNRDKIKSTLLEALHEAGKIMKAGISERRVVKKKSELSIVTASDQESEKLILEIIRHHFPDHSILAEESTPTGKSPSRWIIDPIDGTTNFAHSFPFACVSIAFEEKGQLEFGGVFNPFHHELFFAERGNGATLNGDPITVSNVPLLSDSLLATGFPYDRRENADKYLQIFKAFMMKVQCLRRTGSSALDICYVASGRFDGYWEENLQAWDKAAAMLILEEAGGSFTNFSGKPLTLTDTQNAFSNGFIHEGMLAILKPYAKEKT